MELRLLAITYLLASFRDVHASYLPAWLRIDLLVFCSVRYLLRTYSPYSVRTILFHARGLSQCLSCGGVRG